MSGSRQRSHMKRPVWIIFLVSTVCSFLIFAYIYPLGSSTTCSFISIRGCGNYAEGKLTPSRELTDAGVFSRVIIKEILNSPPVDSINPKVAFLFLTPSSLPFELLWDKFFHCHNTLFFFYPHGHEGRFSVYIHASREKSVHLSHYFVGCDIRSDKVARGKISMVDAERRLVVHALRDPDNQHLVLLSDSCVPLHNFDYVYNYLMFTNVSFIDSFIDPGPLGNGRYSDHMLPEIEKTDSRKGSQWFTLKRRHALVLMSDDLYYPKFKRYCREQKESTYVSEKFGRFKDLGLEV